MAATEIDTDATPELLPSGRVATYEAPFWAGIRDGELHAQQCDSCGRYQHYPRLVCRYCHSQSLTWRTLAGEGAVYSFSVVHRAPDAFRSIVPYVVAVIDLDEGLRMATRVVTTEPAQVRIGSRVRVTYTAEAGAQSAVPLPLFELVDAEIDRPST
jgi:uncharacterized OB-fold protein